MIPDRGGYTLFQNLPPPLGVSHMVVPSFLILTQLCGLVQDDLCLRSVCAATLQRHAFDITSTDVCLIYYLRS